MKSVSTLPNLLTLANAGCGLLAISKAIDALAYPANFDRKLETACWLVCLAMVFDALDGKVARLMDSFSDFGAQLDSFADAITFGVAPAILAKVLIEHHDVGHPRLNFLAAASFALMAILRLARFNLDNDHDESAHSSFDGLPSPAAAGTVVATVLMVLSLGGDIEVADGTPTPLSRGLAILPAGLREMLPGILIPFLAFLLPALGLLMVSRVRYTHLGSVLFRRQVQFPQLTSIVFGALFFYIAPVPFLFVAGVSYVTYGLVRTARSARGRDQDQRRAA